jgi:hypothetical protein
MAPGLNLPHRKSPGMCPVNGIRDLVQWRTGRDWSNEFLWGLGQGGGFAYLRINVADPPRQMFTGNATPRQHRYLAELFGASFTESENRAFKSSWSKACAALDAGTPPVLGPLDMYHLPYYTGLYHQRHIPIHFFLLVGYDEDQAYVLDTNQDKVQTIPRDELQQAWNVNVPGLGKRNRLAILEIPTTLPSDTELVRKAIADQSQSMLRPPVSLLGIPAMKKLADEIAGWPEELGKDRATACLRQVREYLNSPPDAEGNHLTCGRDRTITFLEEASLMSGLDFSSPIRHLQDSMMVVPGIAGAIRRGELIKAGEGFSLMAEAEAEAFQELSKIVSG